MNFLNNLTLIGICAFIASSTLNAGAEELRIKMWHEAYGPGFEIQNKGNAIWVAVALDGSLKDFFKLAENGKKQLTITGDESILLGVYDKEPTINPRGVAGTTFLGSSPNYKYEINAQGKTKYLTYNPAKFNNEAKYFYPQTGTFLGLLGTSSSGHSLKKNITQSEIKMLK